MWWPRPRWKSDIFTHFVLLLFVTITTTNTVMADEGQQNCSGSNVHTVIWTTAFCTVLLVLAVVMAYFVFCKKRVRELSLSPWWKNSPTKNLILQTSAPTKDQQLMNGDRGTDNPAFSSIININDLVPKTGLTRIVRVPSSAIDDMSLGTEFSIKDGDDGKIYVCEHNAGSKDRLVALRLVFDRGQLQQRQMQSTVMSENTGLGQSLVELNRKYYLQAVELEVEVVEAVPPTPGDVAADDRKPAAKPNLLTAVRAKAQSLWHQKQTTSKGTAADVEAGPEPVQGDGEVVAATMAVMTVDETTMTARMSNRPPSLRRYHTLEYGASPPSDDAEQSYTVDPAPAEQPSKSADEPSKSVDEPSKLADETSTSVKEPSTPAKEPSTSAKEPLKPADETSTPAKEPSMSAKEPSKPAKELSTSAKEPSKPADEPRKSEIEPSKPEVEHQNQADGHQKQATPPPPPPRKHSAVSSAITAPTRAVVTATAVTSSAPTPELPISKAAVDDVRLPPDDDYYWCTTTAMVPPAMSTFGKRPTSSSSSSASSSSLATITAVVAADHCRLNGDVDVATEDASPKERGTTSIEDASLPSLSSEDDDDVNASDGDVFVAKVAESDPRTPTRDNKDVGSNNDGNCTPTESAKSSSPTHGTKLPTLKLSLSSPLSSSTNSSCSSLSSSSPTNGTSSSSNNNNNNNSPQTIVSKIPVRRQSAGASIPVASPTNNGITSAVKKSIPLPLSRSSSRLAMWSSAN